MTKTQDQARAVETLADDIDRLKTLLADEGLTRLSYELRQSSDQDGEYYVTEARIFTAEDARLIDLTSADGDWSDTTLALFCAAVNIAPNLLAEIERLQSGAKAFAAQIVEDVTQRAADVVVDLTSQVSTLSTRLAEREQEVEALREAIYGEADGEDVGSLPLQTILDTQNETFAAFKETFSRAETLEARLAESEAREGAEIKRLKCVIERDRSTVAASVEAIRKAIDSREHLREPGRGPFEWDDEQYQREFGDALDEIAVPVDALRKIAHDWSDALPTSEAIYQARALLPADTKEGEGA